MLWELMEEAALRLPPHRVIEYDGIHPSQTAHRTSAIVQPSDVEHLSDSTHTPTFLRDHVCIRPIQ